MQFKQSALRAAIGLALVSLGSNASAAAFALAEQGIATIGNANAGAAAASTDDATTVFFNPAGMSRLTAPTVTSGLHVIGLRSSFSNGNSVAAFGQPAPAGDPGSIGTPTPVPTLFAAMPLNNQIAVGIGVSAPFGLKTEYNDGWIGRFQARTSDVKSININPSISFAVSPQFSLGFGLNFMRMQAELTNNVNYTAVAARGLASQGVSAAQIASFLPALAGREGYAQIKGNDTSYGYNLGALFNLDQSTRIGLAYRSAIKFDLTGDVTFTRPAVTGLPASLAGSINLIQNVGTPDGPVTVALKTPATISLSAVTNVTPALQVMGDITWTEWSNVPGLTINRSTGVLLNKVDYSWSDTMRYSVGATYNYGNGWTGRAGIAFDETPMDKAHRTARLPDNNRLWVSLGGSYQWSPSIRLDAAFTHIFIANSPIQDNQVAGGAGLVHGTYDGSVNIFSVGASMKF